MATTATRADNIAKLLTLATSLARQSARQNFDILSITFARNATGATSTFQAIGWPMNKNLYMTSMKSGLKPLKREIKRPKVANTTRFGSKRK